MSQQTQKYVKLITEKKDLLLEVFKYVPITIDKNYAPKEMELQSVEYYYKETVVRGKPHHLIKFIFSQNIVKYADAKYLEPVELIEISRCILDNKDFKLSNQVLKTNYNLDTFISEKNYGHCDVTGREINWWDRRHEEFFPLLTSEDKHTYWVCKAATSFYLIQCKHSLKLNF